MMFSTLLTLCLLLSVTFSVDNCPNDCDTFSFDGCTTCDCSSTAIGGPTGFCTSNPCTEDMVIVPRYCVDVVKETCPDGCLYYTPGCVSCHCVGDNMWCDNSLVCVWEGIPACIVCSGGREWNECGSACTPTCDDPNPLCTRQCVERCECPLDKPLWDPINEECITAAECPPSCPGGQVWNDCGSACTPTCDDPTPPCTDECVERCECPRDRPIWDGNSCIPGDDCICPLGCDEWFDGCNTCFCDSDPIACTEIACFVREQPECSKCNDGSRWMPCNVEYPVCNNGAIEYITCYQSGACQCRGSRIYDVQKERCIRRSNC